MRVGYDKNRINFGSLTLDMRSACYIEVPALNVNANCNLRVYQFLHE